MRNASCFLQNWLDGRLPVVRADPRRPDVTPERAGPSELLQLRRDVRDIVISLGEELTR